MCAHVFEHQSPCALPSSSQHAAVCFDFTAKDQTQHEKRARGHGRVLKGPKKGRNRSKTEVELKDPKGEILPHVSFRELTYAVYYTIMSLHWKLCL